MRDSETFAEWSARLDARSARIDAAPHFVYRAFDSYGLLLYIGCSLNVEQRLAAHRATSRWHRYAETVGVWGPYSKEEARRAESDAIESEASYFNATKADVRRTQANLHAARRVMADRGDYEPQFDLDRYNREGDSYYAPYELLSDAWRRRFAKTRARLWAASYPFLGDGDRLARYIAAREDAELARQESAA